MRPGVWGCWLPEISLAVLMSECLERTPAQTSDSSRGLTQPSSTTPALAKATRRRAELQALTEGNVRLFCLTNAQLTSLWQFARVPADRDGNRAGDVIFSAAPEPDNLSAVGIAAR